MSDPKPKRPEHTPRGYEWLADAYKRDVEPHGNDAREKVRVALAEGDIVAILHSKVGEIYDVPARMWTKQPLTVKVYPRFEDGWLSQRLELYTGPYVTGPIFIEEGALTDIITLSPDEGAMGTPGKARPKPDARDDDGQPADWRNQLKDWYCDEYLPQFQEGQTTPSRDQDVEAARAAFPKWKFGRESVWRLRSKYAPKKWKEPGARKRTNK